MTFQLPFLFTSEVIRRPVHFLRTYFILQIKDSSNWLPHNSPILIYNTRNLNLKLVRCTCFLAYACRELCKSNAPNCLEKCLASMSRLREKSLPQVWAPAYISFYRFPSSITHIVAYYHPAWLYRKEKPLGFKWSRGTPRRPLNRRLLLFNQRKACINMNAPFLVKSEK